MIFVNKWVVVFDELFIFKDKYFSFIFNAAYDHAIFFIMVF
jgi:hypothetical protein